MTITAAQVKELRDRTGISMMECKNALVATDGDVDKAIDELRKKGLAKAAKKAGRETLEGGIYINSDDSTKSYIVSVSCETDFLANSDKFKNMLVKVAEYLKENGAESKESAQEYINTNFALELGENLKIKDYDIAEGGSVASYVHSNGKIAAVIVAKTADTEKLKQVAMHTTATAPEYLSTNDIPSEVVEKEKSIQLETMKNDPKMANKPEQVLEKIIEGKINKFKSEISLLTQNFVINPDLKVGQFIGEDEIVSFTRLSI